MARNKDKEFKEFLIAQRKKVGPGYMNTPVWIIQKAGKRIWNRRQKRNWKETEFGAQYKQLKEDREKSLSKSPHKSGKRIKSSKSPRRKVRNRNTTIIPKKFIKK
jgi:hypothetical protein